MNLTRADKRKLLAVHGRYVEETGCNSDPDGRWFWPMRVHRNGTTTHARWPCQTERQAWQVLARKHLMS